MPVIDLHPQDIPKAPIAVIIQGTHQIKYIFAVFVYASPHKYGLSVFFPRPFVPAFLLDFLIHLIDKIIILGNRLVGRIYGKGIHIRIDRHHRTEVAFQIIIQILIAIIGKIHGNQILDLLVHKNKRGRIFIALQDHVHVIAGPGKVFLHIAVALLQKYIFRIHIGIGAEADDRHHGGNQKPEEKFPPQRNIF